MKSDYDRDRRGEKNRREYRGERQTGVSKPQTRGREDSYKDSYNGNRMRGAGRRIYPADGNAPRVGRIAENVPQAVRVTGDVSLYPSKPKKARICWWAAIQSAKPFGRAGRWRSCSWRQATFQARRGIL